MRLPLSFFIGLLLSLLGAPVVAHEGHPHEAESEVPAISPSTPVPRLALQSARIELVAVREPAALRIYIDDYDSNAPLKDLRVQLRLGTQLLQAQSEAPGVYRLADDLLPDEAQNVEFQVSGEGWQEQLSGLLPGEAPVEPVQSSNKLRPWIYAAAVLVLAGFALAFGLRRRAS